MLQGRLDTSRLLVVLQHDARMVHAKPLRRGQGQAPLLDLGQDAHHHKQLRAPRWFQVKPVVKEPVAERIGVAAAGRLLQLALRIATLRPSISAWPTSTQSS